MLPTVSVYRRGERNAEPQGEPCLSCTVHLSPAEEGFEFHWDPRASTPTEASETKNVKDKLRLAPGGFSGFHRFLILVCGPVLESSAHLHPSKQLDISVNSPPYTKRPSKEENLNENLCDLPFCFRGPAHFEAPSSSSLEYDLRMRRSPSRTANSDRGALK